MLTIQEDQTIVLDTGRSERVVAVAFHPDGKHLLGGSSDGIRRWRLADGKQVRKKMGIKVYAISVSRNGKWIVCGTGKGASVWDGKLHKKIIDVEGTSEVWAVDVSPDSTRFATGTKEAASIWSITSGAQLAGLGHRFTAGVVGLRFSPNGGYIASAAESRLGWGPWLEETRDIHIFDSHRGDSLVTIRTRIPSNFVCTPLTWSSDAQQIFAACSDNKIRSFDVTIGSELAESPIIHDHDASAIHSLTLAANGTFIATFADRSISFLDTPTLARIGPVIKDNSKIWSTAISPDSRYLGAGRQDGKIVVRDLRKILPDLYAGPFNINVSAFIVQAFWICPIQSITYADKQCRCPLAWKCNLRH